MYRTRILKKYYKVLPPDTFHLTSLYSFAHMGYMAKATTNMDTPPYVRIAPVSTPARIAYLEPIFPVTKFAIASADPNISRNLP